MENNENTTMVALHLSAGFDNINNKILINVVENFFGIWDKASNWIISYLQNKKFKGVHQWNIIRKIKMNYSVPQWSILCPILRNWYSSTILEIMLNNLSGYADDCSLTESFKPGNATVKEKMGCKVNNVRNWMTENHLKMNDSKPEFLVFGTKCNLDENTIPSLNVGDSEIFNNKNVKFLGVILDPHLAFKDHMTNKSKIALYNLSLTHKIETFSQQNSSKCSCGLLYSLT